MHIYAVEKINGIQVLNHDAAIHVLNGEIIAQSASFNNNGDSLTGSIADNKPLISLEEAVKTATALYGLERDNFPASNLNSLGTRLFMSTTFNSEMMHKKNGSKSRSMLKQVKLSMLLIMSTMLLTKSSSSQRTSHWKDLK
jgi:hypothetical protein